MFYVLSKVIFYLLMPITLVLLCLLYAFFKANKGLSKTFIGLGILLIMLFGNGFLVNQVLTVYEYPSTDASSIQNAYDVGIILTGGMIKNRRAVSQEIFVGENADRFLQALRLYKMGKIKKLLISGGNTDLVVMKEDVSSETQEVAKLLLELGVKSNDLILETKARNTHENAIFTAAILKKNPILGKRFLVFSTAWHLPRVKGCFEKAGVKADYFGTCYLGEATSLTLDSLLMPREQRLHQSYFMVHEWIGFLMYKLVGYC